MEEEREVTRRNMMTAAGAIGIGAVAAGTAEGQESPKDERIPNYQPNPRIVEENQTDTFKEALMRLANDQAYRERAVGNPMVLLRDYKLGLKDLAALRRAALMSGADIRSVDRLRGREIIARAGIASARLSDVDVSCCSCCCCCCGETAVLPMTSAS